MKPIELHSGSAEHRVRNLLRLLDVGSRGDRQFEGLRKHGGTGRIYGGEVVAQALVAAMKTVPDDRSVHSLHAYFLRGGSEDHSSTYSVAADFEGRSFSNRRVVATQRGEVILNLAASFHKAESGDHHQAPMPAVPAPEDLPHLFEMKNLPSADDMRWPLNFIWRPWPLVWRIPPIDLTGDPASRTRVAFWFRTPAPVDAPQWMHRAVVAYASDLGPLATASGQYWQPAMQNASIDHSIWFHADLRVDDWLLYYLESPWAGGARGLGLGRVYDRAGRLVASVAQEGLMRVAEKG